MGCTTSGTGWTRASCLFLTGLGVVYAVAFAIGRTVIVLWPLLTPLGSFYATVKTGDIKLALGIDRWLR
jgi:uncharacterized protein